MFNIGFGELAIICIVLIIAVGPERLPSMMKTLGKTLRTLRQASRDIRASTGIDELLRDDFDLYAPPPPRRPAPIPPDASQPAPEPALEAPALEASAADQVQPAPAAASEPKPISREDAVELSAPAAEALSASPEAQPVSRQHAGQNSAQHAGPAFLGATTDIDAPAAESSPHPSPVQREGAVASFPGAGRTLVPGASPQPISREDVSDAHQPSEAKGTAAPTEPVAPARAVTQASVAPAPPVVVVPAPVVIAPAPSTPKDQDPDDSAGGPGTGETKSHGT